jgi:beta-lactamase regulating signal transducer with metallopeptidase domain
MIWIINVGFLLALTCLTGSICMAVWLAAASLLQRRGNARVIYRLLKLVMWGYTMPLVYLAFFGWNRLMTSEGWVLVTTPAVKLTLLVGFLLWIIGAAVYTAFQIPMIYSFRRIRKDRIYATVKMTAVLDRLKKEMGIRKNIVLYQGYMVISPFICGFRRTEIYLPVAHMGERELEIVLRHELTHHKQKDTFWKPAFAIVNGLFWFNPLVWYVSRKMQRWAEASYDESCCRNGLTAKEYFGTIIDMVTSETWRPGACSPLWAEGENELLWRIHCIERNPKDKIRKSWGAMAAAAVMIAGSCTSVCAATLGASELYDEMFRDTRDQAKELSPAKDVIEYTGTTDELFEDLIVEERPDAQPNAIDWTIKSMTVEETICFNKNNGDTIKVAGVIEPGNITIQVGLIEPDGYLRYINVKDSFVYVFDLNKNGSYKVYIENLNSATVSVVGGFS